MKKYIVINGIVGILFLSFYTQAHFLLNVQVLHEIEKTINDYRVSLIIPTRTEITFNSIKVTMPQPNAPDIVKVPGTATPTGTSVTTTAITANTVATPASTARASTTATPAKTARAHTISIAKPASIQKTTDFIPKQLSHEAALLARAQQAVAHQPPLVTDHTEPLITPFSCNTWSRLYGDVCVEHAHNSFDNCGMERPLAQSVFGKTSFTLGDIFLLSKLGAQDALSLPGNGFGSIAQEQYISCLAPTIIKPHAEYKNMGIDLTFFMTQKISDTKELLFNLGIQIPIRCVEKKLDFVFSDSSLQCGSPDVVGGENNIAQFFSDYLDFEDFFRRGVLAPKGLRYDTYQHKSGVGDILFNAYVDCTTHWSSFKYAYAGINLTVPTGSKKRANVLWEIELGNGGATQLGCFSEIQLLVSRHINPYVFCSFAHSFNYRAKERVAQRKSSKSELLIPERFVPYTIAPFSEFDTSVLAFADTASLVTIKPGNQFSAIIGNYWPALFGQPIDFSFLYAFAYAQERSMHIACKNNKLFNKRLWSQHTKAITHSLLWNIYIPCNEKCFVAFNAEQAIAGKNSMKSTLFCAAISILF